MSSIAFRRCPFSKFFEIFRTYFFSKNFEKLASKNFEKFDKIYNYFLKGDGMRRAMIDIKMGDALENFLFSVGNQKYLFHNFNTGPHGATFNHILEFFGIF
jgi:hypothetical protein